MTSPAIRLVGIEKRFGAVHANRSVDLVVEDGTIHGIIGENGAGKSTLMSILFGFYEADAGEIIVHGKPIRIRSSADAIAAGIGMVHQHFMLVETMTVAENVMLGAEGGVLTEGGLAKARAEIVRFGSEYGMQVDPDAIVGELSVGLQQRVEIIKALYRGAQILILDEPTGVLTPAEAEQLFRALAELRRQGRTILLITHKLKEIMAITDSVSVMRRGEMVAHRRTDETSPQELAELMVGRAVGLPTRTGGSVPSDILLDVRGLTVADPRGVVRVHDLSLTVRAGEILGVAGVSGNGQSELVESLSGMLPRRSGEVLLKGQPVPAEAHAGRMRALGLAHVPEDRHRMGLVTSFPAHESAILGHQGSSRYCKGVIIDRNAAIRDTADKMARFDVRPQDPLLKTANFSGGNQQKIVIAREFETEPDVLIIAQPTRGVDIGAIAFIHQKILELKAAGKAILLVSVELDEIFALSDRIAVMCGGRVMGVRRTEETDQNEIGLMMAGLEGATTGDAA
ncbi:MAG: heme ABC transporter ATP-binding protein [Methylobacterium sp.]|nr:MAG: heme ABC transporter ATP-binding protein [Methylobacterium sp.]